MSRFLLTLGLVVGTLAMQACADETASAPEVVDETSTLLAASAPTCTLTEIIPATQVNASERGAFLSDGRFFTIGTRPDSTDSFIFEVTKSASGYSAVDYVTGSLEGTVDGLLGSKPRGGACSFSGLAVHDDVLYAGCVAMDASSVVLLQVDTKQRSVRAGTFTTCNFEPASKRCKPLLLYPNGTAIDRAGRIYVTDMLVHTTGGNGTPPYSIAQITVDPDPAEPWLLRFRYRAWLTADRLVDGPGPNGIQIKDDVLYYVGGPNVNAVPIRSDGSAGKLRVHYRGPILSYIDDFALGDGEIMLARTIPGEIVGLDSPPGARSARAFATCPTPFGAASSLTYQPEVASDQVLFSPGALVVTSVFGGGLYTLAPLL